MADDEYKKIFDRAKPKKAPKAGKRSLWIDTPLPKAALKLALNSEFFSDGDEPTPEELDLILAARHREEMGEDLRQIDACALQIFEFTQSLQGVVLDWEVAKKSNFENLSALSLVHEAENLRKDLKLARKRLAHALGSSTGKQKETQARLDEIKRVIAAYKWKPSGRDGRIQRGDIKPKLLTLLKKEGVISNQEDAYSAVYALFPAARKRRNSAI